MLPQVVKQAVLPQVVKQAEESCLRFMFYLLTSAPANHACMSLDRKRRVCACDAARCIVGMPDGKVPSKQTHLLDPQTN